MCSPRLPQPAGRVKVRRGSGGGKSRGEKPDRFSSCGTLTRRIRRRRTRASFRVSLAEIGASRCPRVEQRAYRARGGGGRAANHGASSLLSKTRLARTTRARFGRPVAGGSSCWAPTRGAAGTGTDARLHGLAGKPSRTRAKRRRGRECPARKLAGESEPARRSSQVG